MLKKLNYGDKIGVIAPSNPIIESNIQELEMAKKLVEEKGFKVEFSKHFFLIQMVIVRHLKKKQKI